jgi:hypothetical protein
MPTLVGYAGVNALTRYALLTDLLDTLFLYEPGNSRKAMQV